MSQDCLNEIFECLEKDKDTLRSCLLVNRLWCEISVRILWRSIRNYNTLIACLPNESKEMLYRNKIITSASEASTPPTFNYVSFCKVLSISMVNNEIRQLLKKQPLINPTQNLDSNLHIVMEEISKFLVTQSSLRSIDLLSCSPLIIRNFISLPGVINCLKNITELYILSDISPEFLYQLSRNCHNIQSLCMEFLEVISSGITDLISVQQNLKCLHVTQRNGCDYLPADIITSLTRHVNTLIKLNFYGESRNSMPSSLISKFPHLEEIVLSFGYQDTFEAFKELQDITYSQLQILNFSGTCPRSELLIKFLENNGKNLKELYVYGDGGISNSLNLAGGISNSLNLAIAKFCPNLRKIFTGFYRDELETLKMIFNACQYLESIKIWCCGYYLSEKDLIEAVAKYSPNNVCELNLCYSYWAQSELLPEELEFFFTSWMRRIPQKSLSLIVILGDAFSTLDDNNENRMVIEKYIKLGTVKEFQIE